jgi:L-serine dehydratase
MSFNSGAALAALCAQNKTTISEEMIRREMQVTGSGRDEIIQRMAHSYEIMKNAVRTSLTEDIQYSMQGRSFPGGFEVSNRRSSRRSSTGSGDSVGARAGTTG